MSLERIDGEIRDTVQFTMTMASGLLAPQYQTIFNVPKSDPFQSNVKSGNLPESMDIYQLEGQLKGENIEVPDGTLVFDTWEDYMRLPLTWLFKSVTIHNNKFFISLYCISC